MGWSVHVLFGDGSVGQTVLVLSRFVAFFLWAGQDDGVVMIFVCGGVGGVGPLSCTLPTQSCCIY